MEIKSYISFLLSRFNYKISRIEPKDPHAFYFAHLSEELKARQLFLKYFSITLLLDVGANTGQYASLLRRIGYKGRIVSFEPLSSAFVELKNKVDSDENWIAENYALGNKDEVTIINISGNSYSSSLLEILPSHIAFDGDSKYIAEETIEIKRLDSIFQNFCHVNDVILLKIDTQGFEKKVLEGAKHSLNKIAIIQLEISIEPLYEDETLFVEMVNYLNDLGFELFTLENGIRNTQSGKLLQVDGIFVNKNI